MGGEERAGVRDARQHTADVAHAAPPRDEREDIEREPGRVDDGVHRPDPARVVLEVAPVVEAGERGRHRADDPDLQRFVRSFRAGEIEREGGRPRADRNVGQRRMERIAEPDAVEEVADRLRHGLHGFLQRLRNRIERLREIGELLREAQIRHGRSRPPLA